MDAVSLVMNVNKMQKYNLQTWQQIGCYLVLSSVLFILLLLLGLLFDFLNFEEWILLYPSIGGMLLSLLFVNLYFCMYRIGILKFLSNQKKFLQVNLLLFIIGFFICVVSYSVILYSLSSTYNLSGYKEFFNLLWNYGLSDFFKASLYIWRKYDELPDSLFFIIMIILFPYILTLSTISFVIHKRQFANNYFWFLLSPYFILLFPLIIVLPPLLIYYPLMLKYTNHLRRKYNINLPIESKLGSVSDKISNADRYFELNGFTLPPKSPKNQDNQNKKHSKKQK